jgi:hypothetical protein
MIFHSNFQPKGSSSREMSNANCLLMELTSGELDFSKLVGKEPSQT